MVMKDTMMHKTYMSNRPKNMQFWIIKKPDFLRNETENMNKGPKRISTHDRQFTNPIP